MSDPLVERLIVSVSAMLVHSLWQGALIGVCLVVALQLTRRRYFATASALSLLAVCSLATWWLAFAVPVDAGLDAGGGFAVTVEQLPESAVLPPAASENVANGVVPETSPRESTTTPDPVPEISRIEDAVPATSHWRAWVVCLWLAGFAVFAARLCRDWMAVRRLQLTSTALDPSSQWTMRLRELAHRMHVTASVDLRTSPAVTSPVTFGVLRPLILLPPAMLTHLAPTHLEALLLHELAHIRRKDYFANLLQNAMECVFFFHPVVWWMSGLMRVEREFCCDAMAASECRDKSTYATALASLETARCEVPPTIALAAIGRGRPELLQRIRQLAGYADRKRFGAATLAGMLFMVALTGSVIATIASVYDSGEATSANVDWSTLRTTHYEADQTHILFLHTAEMVHSVLLISPPEEFLSANSSCRVDRATPGDDFVASADFQWDGSDINLVFDTQKESIVRINERAYSLAAGRVLYFNVGDDVPRQSGVLQDGLPAPGATLPEELRQAVSKVRMQALKQFSRSSDTVTVARGHGRWQLSDGRVLEIKYSPLNGPNLQTYGVIHWPRTETEPARYCRFDIAEDVFGNREPWAVAWREGVPTLWVVTGERQLMGIPEQPAATELRSIDFQDSHHVRVQKYDGIPSATGLRESVIAELSRVIPLTADGQASGQIHLTSVPGEASPLGWVYNPLDVVVFLDADNKTWINGDRTEVSEEELRRVRLWRLNDWKKQVAGSNPQFQSAVAETPPMIRAVVMTRAGASETQVERLIEMCTAASLWGTARHTNQEATNDESAQIEGEGFAPPQPIQNDDEVDEASGQSADPPAAEPPPDHRVTVFGKVIDDVTGEVIPQVVAIQGGLFDRNRPGSAVSWGYSLRRRGGSEGRFFATVNWPRGQTARVLVDGYLPAPVVTEAPEPGVSRIETNLRLTPCRSVSGQVLDHTGEPVAGASVFATRLVPINIHGGRAWNSTGGDDPSTVVRKTDSEGRFAELRVSDLNSVAVSTEDLDAWSVVLEDEQQDVVIRMPEPATLEINYEIPGAEQETEVYLQYLTPFTTGGEAWKNVHPEREFQIQQGRSVFPTLTPGRYQIMRRKVIQMESIGRYITMGREYFEVEAGETQVINWTRPNGGARLTARVTWPVDVELQGITFSVAGAPRRDFGGQEVTNLLDGGRVDLESGRLQSAVLPAGEYTLMLSAQKPVSEERLRISSPILPDYSHDVQFVVSPNQTEVVLDDINLEFK